jgi:hypothetical protein
MQMTPNCTKSLPAVIVIVRLYNTPYPILISSWTMENNLRFNVSKCKFLTITRRKNPIIHDYTLGSQNLTREDSEKDLGITTTSKLSWDIHANTIVAKVNKMLGVLRRTCTKLMDMKARRILYLSLVKSQLCYATEVWSPVNIVQISRRVEKVQRRATVGG